MPIKIKIADFGYFRTFVFVIRLYFPCSVVCENVAGDVYFKTDEQKLAYCASRQNDANYTYRK